MQASRGLRFLWIAILIACFALPDTFANSQRYAQLPEGDQPPILQGGEWIDDLLGTSSIETYNSYSNWGRIILKPVEYLDWTQTWTVHFASGEFFQTEAISDSVQLAESGIDQFFTTGTYTSKVFDAGRQVDWLHSDWKHTQSFPLVTIRFRTGNTPTPDYAWSDWILPSGTSMVFFCAIRIDTLRTECNSNMTGIESSRYIQYRASFSSHDPSQTVSLEDIRLQYGIHPPLGTATSVLLSPIDLFAWDSVIISSTIPLNTSLVIDVQAPDGSVLIPDVKNEDSLASIDPHEYPSIRLQATFTTSEVSLTPELDLWGVRWLVTQKLYLPAILR